MERDMLCFTADMLARGDVAIACVDVYDVVDAMKD